MNPKMRLRSGNRTRSGSWQLLPLMLLLLAPFLPALQAVPGPLSAACRPTIRFTSTPAYGSFDDLVGAVDCFEDHTVYDVAVYIFVDGWWTKPTFVNPLTPVAGDGRWTTDITTGGADHTATKIAAFLLPAGVDPPLMSGGAPLPDSLFADAVDVANVERRERTLTFAGLEWLVKSSNSPVGPGPNYFSDAPDAVWVDDAGRLHLTIALREGQWRSTEVISTAPLGYGAYTVRLVSPVDNLDPNVILGLFTWDSVAPASQAFRELDIEFSRWGQAGIAENAQYVVQPYGVTGHLHRFPFTPATVTTTHRISWQPGRASFASYNGLQPLPGQELHAWTHLHSDVPREGNANARLNLWLLGGAPPTGGLPVEVVFDDFSFVPGTLDLRIAQAQGGLKLSWIDRLGSFCDYTVHRSEKPYVAPDATTEAAILPGEATQWVDDDLSGVAAYYQLQASSCRESLAVLSNEVGRLSFTLVTGGSIAPPGP